MMTFKKILLVTFIAFGFAFSANAQINCDSIKLEFNKQLAELKKQGQSAEVIKGLEGTRDMMLKIYCPDVKNAQPNLEKAPAIPKNINGAMAKGAKKSLNLSTSYEIVLSLTTIEEGVRTKTGITYYLADNGESIFIPRDGFTGKGMLPEQAEGTFDGWHIPFKAAQVMYATNPEMGKIAYSMPSQQKFMINQNPANLKVIKTGTKKTVAGYPCDGYKVTGSQDGEAFSFNCFVSSGSLPFQQKGYAGLSMITASTLGILGGERRGVLEITGTSESDGVSMTVTSIKPLVKNISLSGYTLFGAAAY